MRDIERLSERLKEPFFIDGHEMFSSASIGVSLFPMHGSDHQALRANADAAMYRMKGAAKGGVNFFEPGLGDKAAERAKLEQRLRLAIRDRRLCCAFQPKVDFRSQIGGRDRSPAALARRRRRDSGRPEISSISPSNLG